MTVVTISRERGSDGALVGQLVAQHLGYDYVDKEIIEGVFRQYGMTKFNDIYTSTPGILDMVSYTTLYTIAMLNEIIEAIAQRGNVVLVGRGGFAVLGAYSDVLNVRVEAPVSVRVERIMARESLATLDDAMTQVTSDNTMRRKFVQMFYSKRWDDESNFDLIVDTGAQSTEAAAQQIVDAVTALQQTPAGKDTVTTATLNVDPVLADAVAKAMANPLPHLE